MATAALTAAAAPAMVDQASATPTVHHVRGSGTPPQQGGTHHNRHAHRAHHAGRVTEVQRFQSEASKVIAEARRQKGKPYVYGADGPHSFDCSGLVRYVFLHALHKSLPHNAAEQYSVSHHLRRSQLRPGDLVFVDDGGYISHVGIFAGHGYWWVAPHTGTRVQRQKIYAAHFVYGRIIPWPKNR